MMKKNGFTLAEVLITLSIIGVVATMTLPALMTNTQEQQAKTGLKKGINTLTEVAQMHEALEGINYAMLTGDSVITDISATKDESTGQVKTNGVNSFVGMLRERAKVDKEKTEKNAQAPLKTVLNEEDATVYFLDGTALTLLLSEAKTTVDNGKISDADNLPVGFRIVYDTNGSKGPNILSNCVQTLTGADDSSNDVTVCDDKSKRVIRDQFQLQLRGSHVEPLGAASTWAFSN